METNAKYQEKPALSQLDHLIEILKIKGYIPQDTSFAEFNGITLKQYKFLLALNYNNEQEKLKEVLKDLSIKTSL